MNATEIISMLGLQPHPEGGHYRQTWIAQAPPDERPSGTCIYFLLARGEASHWHRVDATEIWHFHAGSSLELRVAESRSGPSRLHCLGPDLKSGARPQCIVPQHFWQTARSTGDWSLVSCTVSPGFSFDGFELAPPGFDVPEA